MTEESVKANWTLFQVPKEFGLAVPITKAGTEVGEPRCDPGVAAGAEPELR